MGITASVLRLTGIYAAAFTTNNGVRAITVQPDSISNTNAEETWPSIPGCFLANRWTCLLFRNAFTSLETANFFIEEFFRIDIEQPLYFQGCPCLLEGHFKRQTVPVSQFAPVRHPSGN